MSSKRITIEEAADVMLSNFRSEGHDPQEIMDEYETRMLADSTSRATFLAAARAWREDALERLERIEERLDKLEGGGE